jgi:hypothetical protein
LGHLSDERSSSTLPSTYRNDNHKNRLQFPVPISDNDEQETTKIRKAFFHRFACCIRAIVALGSVWQTMIVPMAFNRSSWTILLSNEPILSACRNTAESALFLHLCHTWLITLFTLLPSVIFVLLAIQIAGSLCTHEYIRNNIDFWEDFGLYMQPNRFARYVQAEIHLIVCYVCVAFVSNRVLFHHPVNMMTIARWCIEAAGHRALCSVLGRCMLT